MTERWKRDSTRVCNLHRNPFLKPRFQRSTFLSIRFLGRCPRLELRPRRWRSKNSHHQSRRSLGVGGFAGNSPQNLFSTKSIDATTNSVLLTAPTLCVVLSAAFVTTKSSTPASLVIAPAFAAAGFVYSAPIASRHTSKSSEVISALSNATEHMRRSTDASSSTVWPKHAKNARSALWRLKRL